MAQDKGTHELAHGIGVDHHGSQSWGSTYKQVTEKMKAWTIYDLKRQ